MWLLRWCGVKERRCYGQARGKGQLFMSTVFVLRVIALRGVCRISRLLENCLCFGRLGRECDVGGCELRRTRNSRPLESDVAATGVFGTRRANPTSIYRPLSTKIPHMILYAIPFEHFPLGSATQAVPSISPPRNAIAMPYTSNSTYPHHNPPDIPTNTASNIFNP